LPQRHGNNSLDDSRIAHVIQMNNNWFVCSLEFEYEITQFLKRNLHLPEMRCIIQLQIFEKHTQFRHANERYIIQHTVHSEIRQGWLARIQGLYLSRSVRSRNISPNGVVIANYVFHNNAQKVGFMIKKIGIKELRPGMFVHDLNCGHISHPLLHTRFKLNSDQEVENLVKRGVSSVYIDTNLGIDSRDAPTAEEVRRNIDSDLLKLAESNVNQGSEQKHTSREDFQFAVHVHEEANQTVREIMATARLGKSSKLEQVSPVVQDVVESIFRNSSPLLHLNTIRTKDQYLFYHSVSTCSLISAFAHRLGICSDITRQIAIGTLLHDIGKTRVPESILNKPGRLTESEFDEIRLHVAHGIEILAGMPGLTNISKQVVAQHHERYDGTGYPAGLKGNQISHYGQMAAIVDVYDAITSDRSYHAAMEPVEAIRKLREWSEQHFNVDLVDHFICCVGIYPVGTLNKLESGLMGVVSRHNPADLTRPVVMVIYDSIRQCHITPYEIDLASQSADRITGYESAKKWGIDMAEITSMMAVVGKN
jgi:putative nucleotidyltransferase with HDIG domain